MELKDDDQADTIIHNSRVVYHYRKSKSKGLIAADARKLQHVGNNESN